MKMGPRANYLTDLSLNSLIGKMRLITPNLELAWEKEAPRQTYWFHSFVQLKPSGWESVNCSLIVSRETGLMGVLCQIVLSFSSDTCPLPHKYKVRISWHNKSIGGLFAYYNIFCEGLGWDRGSEEGSKEGENLGTSVKLLTIKFFKIKFLNF